MPPFFPGKQFKCTVCDYTAAQKPQLLRHMEQHASFKVRAARVRGLPVHGFPREVGSAWLTAPGAPLTSRPQQCSGSGGAAHQREGVQLPSETAVI